MHCGTKRLRVFESQSQQVILPVDLFDSLADSSVHEFPTAWLLDKARLFSYRNFILIRVSEASTPSSCTVTVSAVFMTIASNPSRM